MLVSSIALLSAVRPGAQHKTLLCLRFTPFKVKKTKSILGAENIAVISYCLLSTFR